MTRSGAFPPSPGRKPRGAAAPTPAPWAFDLDGTLVDALSASDLRPLAREVIERLRANHVTVVVWSAGGADYARRVANRVGIGDLVDAFYDKTRAPDGTWELDRFEPSHRPGTCVDDETAALPRCVRVVAIRPYLGRNPHDRAFARVLEEISGPGATE